MSDTSNPMNDFPEENIKFAGTAYLIAQRDGITPEEAARRLGELLGSPDVVAQANASREAEAAAAAQKEAQVNETVSAISSKLGELQALLSQQ